MNKIEL